MSSAGHNILVGQLGEDLASQYLIDHGYKIIDKNFHTRFGEIDLIAQKVGQPTLDDEILFLEVKTRTSKLFGYPEQAVDAKKIKHLLEAIKIYRQVNQRNNFWRLDIISIEIVNGEVKDLRWFKDVSAKY